MKRSGPHWRGRTRAVLRDNRLVIVAELLVVVALQILHATRVISTPAVYLFIVGWLSLWLRRSGWRHVGLTRPAGWLRTLGIGAVAGVAYQAISIWLVVPVLHRLTGQPLDLSQFASLRGNVTSLIVWLAASWTLAAFGEEMAYRGYVLNRLSDLFGRGRVGWAVGLIGSAILFGFGHAYQGATGILETSLFACVMGGMYLAGGRNLWLPIVAHGVYDTVAFVLIFLGLYP